MGIFSRRAYAELKQANLHENEIRIYEDCLEDISKQTSKIAIFEATKTKQDRLKEQLDKNIKTKKDQIKDLKAKFKSEHGFFARQFLKRLPFSQYRKEMKALKKQQKRLKQDRKRAEYISKIVDAKKDAQYAALKRSEKSVKNYERLFKTFYREEKDSIRFIHMMNENKFMIEQIYDDNTKAYLQEMLEDAKNSRHVEQLPLKLKSMNRDIKLFKRGRLPVKNTRTLNEESSNGKKKERRDAWREDINMRYFEQDGVKINAECFRQASAKLKLTDKECLIFMGTMSSEGLQAGLDFVNKVRNGESIEEYKNSEANYMQKGAQAFVDALSKAGMQPESNVEAFFQRFVKSYNDKVQEAEVLETVINRNSDRDTTRGDAA